MIGMNTKIQFDCSGKDTGRRLLETLDFVGAAARFRLSRNYANYNLLPIYGGVIGTKGGRQT